MIKFISFTEYLAENRISCNSSSYFVSFLGKGDVSKIEETKKSNRIFICPAYLRSGGTLIMDQELTCREIFASKTRGFILHDTWGKDSKLYIFMNINSKDIEYINYCIEYFEKHFLQLRNSQTEIYNYNKDYPNCFCFIVPKRWVRFPILVYIYLTIIRYAVLFEKNKDIKEAYAVHDKLILSALALYRGTLTTQNEAHPNFIMNLFFKFILEGHTFDEMVEPAKYSKKVWQNTQDGPINLIKHISSNNSKQEAISKISDLSENNGLNEYFLNWLIENIYINKTIIF